MDREHTTFLKYLMTAAGTAFLSMLGVASFNYHADPFWVFLPAHPLSELYHLRDERQAKTNLVHFGSDTYRGVLFGSSRTTVLDTSELGDGIFNYSVSSANPDEYLAYLGYFAREKGRPEKIYLGVDFFGTRVKVQRVYDSPQSYIRKSLARPYPLETLFGIDTLLTGLTNVLWYSRVRPSDLRLYTRDAVAHQPRPTGAVPIDETALQSDLDWYARNRFRDDVYRYNEKLADFFRKLRDAYPESEFIVFTTPISLPMYRMLMREGRFEDYARWLRELVSIFGKVQDFMGDNSFTRNLLHYRDAHHIWETDMRTLARRVAGERVPGFEDFGIMVTQENLGSYLTRKRAALPALLASGKPRKPD